MTRSPGRSRGGLAGFWPDAGASRPVWRRAGRLALALAGAALLAGVAAAPAAVFSVRDHGASGDGQTLDTAAIDRAIEACAAAGGGQVRFPPGRYLSGTVRLRSHVTLHLEEGATLLGTTNLDLYQTFSATNALPRLRVSRWHRGLVMAENAEDIAIVGRGAIDGQHVFDPRGEERMRGPHTLLLGHCRNFRLQDVLLTNSANYALLFFFTDQVEVRNATFAGGWDGVHFRGSIERFCNDVRIVDSRFYTGDDAIAGSYWRDVTISNCVINSSCNGVRLIGPAVHSAIAHCDFFGPGLHEHRTSRAQRRTNMLAGICLQPGAWEPMEGPLDDFRISDVTMRNVAAPFHIALRQGNTAGRILIERVNATGAYRAPCSVESWGDSSFSNVVFRDATFEFTGGGAPEPRPAAVRPPGVDARPLPAWGFYARRVQRLVFDNVRLRFEKTDLRPAVICDGVEAVEFNDFSFPQPAESPALMILDGAGEVRARGGEVSLTTATGAGLTALAEDGANRLRAGRPFSVRVSLPAGPRQGLAQVELEAAGRQHSRWVWLRAGQKSEVTFHGLVAPTAGPLELRCGAIKDSVNVEP